VHLLNVSNYYRHFSATGGGEQSSRDDCGKECRCQTISPPDPEITMRTMIAGTPRDTTRWSRQCLPWWNISSISCSSVSRVSRCGCNWNGGGSSVWHLYPVYTIKQSSGKRPANIEQLENTRRARVFW